MKIVVGMSGGVDSTVVAYLLKKEGHEVLGVYLDFLDSNINDVVVNEGELDDISKKLDIKIYKKNYSEEFKNLVIENFVTSYKNGRTPNPCALCNGIMKFRKLLDIKNELNADMIATGHYAKVACKGDRYYISKSDNLKKDQSYMLYTLSQDILKSLILPIGDMDKNEVRNIAKDLGLTVYDKKDSQDVCFIKGIDYKEFIKQYDFGYDYNEKLALGIISKTELDNRSYLKRGEFVDLDGKVIGYHDGIINYTIGQRKGLNIAFGERKFVLSIDAKNNRVVLGSNEDLMQKEFFMSDVVFQKATDVHSIEKLYAKLRYRHDGTECMVEKTEDIYHVILKEPARAITNGQSAVFYDSDGDIAFGGIIGVTHEI